MRNSAPVLLLSALRSLVLVLLFAVPCRAEDGTTVAGVVVDEKGSPVAEATVTLHVGWARYALTPEFDRWYAIETKTATTGDDGRFSVADLPKGTVATAYVNTGKAIGVAQGKGELNVHLAPPGGVQGKVTGKRQELKAVRIFVQGGMGLGTGRATVDKKTGKYKVGGLPLGPGRVFVSLDNWTLARFDVEIPPEKPAKVKTAKCVGKFLPTADPQVDVTKARLVDAQGKPVPKVQLSWSSRWMDGGMSSDEDGIVKLAGGGVAIGRPPYYLRLSHLRAEQGAFRGVFKKVKRGVAIVELQPLREVKGTVNRAGAAVEKYRLIVVGPGEPARIRLANVEDGAFNVWVPDGNCRFVIGTVDGKVQEQAVAVTPDSGTLEIQLE